ncbi:MAG: glucokinase, partial [candidate division NC10 bacterium]
MEHLSAIYGRVDNDRVISGPGLINIFRFTHGVTGTGRACRTIGAGVDNTELPAAISACALAGRCEQCVEAFEMF